MVWLTASLGDIAHLKWIPSLGVYLTYRLEPGLPTKVVHLDSRMADLPHRDGGSARGMATAPPHLPPRARFAN
jgi:hypothetical protein